jgi:hypothetical protein
MEVERGGRGGSRFFGVAYDQKIYHRTLILWKLQLENKFQRNGLIDV